MRGIKILITKEKILSAIQKVAKELGRGPTREELEQFGGISVAVVRRLFGRHRTAVRAAGLEAAPTGPDRLITNQQLLENWGEVARELGRAPTKAEYQGAGKYSERSLVLRFQRWSATPRAFVEAAGKGELRGDWKDVLEIIRETPTPVPGGSRWMKNFMAAARRAKRANGAEAKQAIPGLPPPLQGKQCVTAAMLAMLLASIVLGGGCLRRVLPDRPLLGPPMHVARLTHEPVNEMGVSMLFAM